MATPLPQAVHDQIHATHEGRPAWTSSSTILMKSKMATFGIDAHKARNAGTAVSPARNTLMQAATQATEGDPNSLAHKVKAGRLAATWNDTLINQITTRTEQRQGLTETSEEHTDNLAHDGEDGDPDIKHQHEKAAELIEEVDAEIAQQDHEAIQKLMEEQDRAPGDDDNHFLDTDMPTNVDDVGGEISSWVNHSDLAVEAESSLKSAVQEAMTQGKSKEEIKQIISNAKSSDASQSANQVNKMNTVTNPKKNSEHCRQLSAKSSDGTIKSGSGKRFLGPKSNQFHTPTHRLDKSRPQATAPETKKQSGSGPSASSPG